MKSSYLTILFNSIKDMNHDLLFKSDVYALGRVLEELNYHLFL